ncbi:MAG TPA: hypothetical protein VHC22_21855 [Pirellulales bacterium]|nr:hypothetical protein [Pirellulales bacterium]
MKDDINKQLAKCLAFFCVRNTCIEDIHAGMTPASPAGDFSDVKVVTPQGEIPWSKVSRISNDEMRHFMKEVVSKLYTMLTRLDDPAFVDQMDQYVRRATSAWDDPEDLEDWFDGN